MNDAADRELKVHKWLAINALCALVNVFMVVGVCLSGASSFLCDGGMKMESKSRSAVSLKRIKEL